jgi:hypothetical protein
VSRDFEPRSGEPANASRHAGRLAGLSGDFEPHRGEPAFGRQPVAAAPRPSAIAHAGAMAGLSREFELRITLPSHID